MTTDSDSSGATNRNGGINLNAQGNTHIGGDVVGGDKITEITIINYGQIDSPFSKEQYLFELDRIYHETKIEDWYVEPDGFVEREDETREEVRVEQYISDWLESKSRHHLAILGDYGTGKSWLCLCLAKQLADQHCKSPDQFPLPLLISFRRYKPKMKMFELVESELFDGYGVSVQNRAIFRRQIQNGQLLPILDGMDEMAKELGELTALVAYSQLDLTLEIPKVIVTCRTHYFYSGSEERGILTPDRKEVVLEHLPKFDILHLRLFDRSKIVEYLSRRFNSSKSDEMASFVNSTYDLHELCSRPVLLSLVCDSDELLHDLPGPLSSVVLYEAYINAWLQRELREGRLVIDPESVKELFEDLAQYMVMNDTLILEAEQLRKMLAEFLDRRGVSIERRNEVERQLVTSAFVKRSLSDSWEFAHRSFQEFFYARRFFRWERHTKGRGTYPVVHIPIWQYIAEMVLSEWNEAKARFWIMPQVDRQDDSTLTLTTLRAAAAYWLIKKGPLAAREYPLSGIMLDSVDLQGLDFGRCDLSHADFNRSNLSRTKFILADLERSSLVIANFESSELDGAILRKSDCRGAYFGNANLSGVDFGEASLEYASFVGANIERSRFEGASIGYADFRGANFGKPGSEIWRNVMDQLRQCIGYKDAYFDEYDVEYYATIC
jgi:uncharacterized protein YjbI with pentapeptide repeats